MITIYSKPAQVKFAWIMLVLALALIAWCTNPWQLYFLNDDFIHIPKAYDGTLGHHHALRHVNDLSLYLDSLLSKENATGYHITNLLLHYSNILLAIPLFKKIASSLQCRVSEPIVLLMAGLFGVYAFHSEALFWILCRTASLSLFFNILSWLCFFKVLNNRLWLLPMIIFFLLGIFTYEAVWVFPFWLIAWYFILPKISLQKSKAILPILVIWGFFIVYFPIRLKITGELLGTYMANDVQQFNIISIIQKTAKLFARSFLPPMQSPKLFVAMCFIAICCMAAFGWLLWKRKKINKLLLFLLMAWLLSYFPYISMGVSTNGYESERYLYFPSLFLCAAVVYAGVLLWRHKPIKLVLFMSIIFLYHIYFFVKVSEVFKTISSYSKEGITAIKEVPLSKKIVIRNLPTYSNGLPVFNYGFLNAVMWLAPGRDSMNVDVLNKAVFRKENIIITKDITGATADTLTFSAH